jgi:3',5'-cyclic AMP phosphodiesterase CpdA
LGEGWVGTGRAGAPSVTILHISDTQFGRYHRFGAGVESLGNHLIYDLRELVGRQVPRIDLILISGDIAEQGLKKEYDQARAFIDQLCGFTELTPDRVVVVPGNHDVNWDLSEAYFAECRADECDAREPYTRKWRHYQRFVADLHGEEAFTEDQPYRLHRFDDLGVVVAALNSTWRESHREQDHYGWCGTEQLRWFEDQLRGVTGMARIGLAHHNARRRAQADNENLRDADDLDNILAPHLDLLLHGHTHDGKEDRLPDGTLVLATGSTAVKPDWRPAEVPNQYQVLHLSHGMLTRSGRQWDGAQRQWIADTRVGHGRNDWQARIPFDPPGWRSGGRPDDESTVHRDRFDERGRRDDDFVSQVEYVTRRDVGEQARIERRSRGQPPLEYLLVLRRAAPDRCVGVLDQAAGTTELERFDELVFGPLRERGPADFVLVHRGPDVPELRTAARNRGIRIKTWTEYNDLLEPGTYAAWLRTELESDELYPQSLYQEQRFRNIDRFGKQGREIRTDLVSEIYDSMLDEDGRFVLLLGDAGYGKSFLVRRLAYLMLGNNQSGVTPIVIYLRDRDKRQTIDEMVSNVFIPSRAVFNADRFQHSLEAGSLALLIDGYDEFAVRVGYLNAAAQLNTFIQALRGRAKVLLTTRPSHFRSADEVTSKLFDSLRTVHHGRVYQLEPFDESQQRAFLTRWFELRGDGRASDTAGRWMAALGQVDNLPELAKTPRMLSFMAEDLTLDEVDAAAGEGTVTAAALYQRLIDHWLETETTKIDSDDERRVPANERQRVLEELALELWRIGERDVTEQSLQVAARELDLAKHKLTLDQAAQVLGGRTLLQVDRNRWRFAHQSVWEFLLAKRLAAILRGGHDIEIMGEAELTGLTIRFLRDLAPDEAAAWARRIAGQRP